MEVELPSKDATAGEINMEPGSSKEKIYSGMMGQNTVFLYR